MMHHHLKNIKTGIFHLMLVWVLAYYKLLKEALSTRKALQKKPNIDLIKELSDEDVKLISGIQGEWSTMRDPDFITF